MAHFRGAVLNCVICNKEFKVPPSRAGTAKTCSKDCADKIRNAGKVKEKVKLTCKECGSVFYEHESHAKRRVCCTEECWRKYMGKARFGTKRGANNPAWKGGLVEHSRGYLYVHAPDHPFASNAYVFEHRLIMERWLREHRPKSQYLTGLGNNKYLRQDIIVHHKNGDKKDNRLENLECMTQSEHMRHHRAEQK